MSGGASIAELRIPKVLEKQTEKEERKQKVRQTDVAELRLSL
jgi:hypothetical protein